MNVLWISNITFPEAAAKLGHPGDLKKSGGWMTSMAEELQKEKNINLAVISTSNWVKKFTIINGEKIVYYIVPKCKNPKDYEKYMVQARDLAKPDVVHIHGTEFPYGYAYINACGTHHVVVSIQGVISVIAKYYYAGLSWSDIFKNLTLRDCLKTTIFGEKRNFVRRGELEKSVIKRVNHVIGRTLFDESHCMALNPHINYYYCAESLREEFYSGQWCYEKCIPHSIFLSQSTYPLKGLHQLLKAMPLVLQKYPDAHIRIAGADITRKNTISEKLTITGYGKLISGLIRKLSLQNHVSFIGALTASQMKEEYLRANLFVCPSSIENSSNSLGEAQMLGLPCLASYVGGLPDMIPDKRYGDLYRFEESEMLAMKICRVFEDSFSFVNDDLIKYARMRHDRETNTKNLMDVYSIIVES